MYCLRVFIVVLQELRTLFTTMFTVIFLCVHLNSMCVPSFMLIVVMSILIGFCVCELHVHLHACPHSNVWPEAVLLTLGAHAQRGLR